MPPSVLGQVRVFVRAVLTEMGKKRGGSESAEKVIFGKKVKNCGGKQCIISGGGIPPTIRLNPNSVSHMLISLRSGGRMMQVPPSLGYLCKRLAL